MEVLQGQQGLPQLQVLLVDSREALNSLVGIFRGLATTIYLRNLGFLSTGRTFLLRATRLRQNRCLN
jgi:hypothetical protein